MKFLYVIWISLLVGVCNASEEDDVVPVKKDPLDIVLVCPEHSVHKGDEVPHWAVSYTHLTLPTTPYV